MFSSALAVAETTFFCKQEQILIQRRNFLFLAPSFPARTANPPALPVRLVEFALDSVAGNKLFPYSPVHKKPLNLTRYVCVNFSGFAH